MSQPTFGVEAIAGGWYAYLETGTTHCPPICGDGCGYPGIAGRSLDRIGLECFAEADFLRPCRHSLEDDRAERTVTARDTDDTTNRQSGSPAPVFGGSDLRRFRSSGVLIFGGPDLRRSRSSAVSVTVNPRRVWRCLGQARVRPGGRAPIGRRSHGGWHESAPNREPWFAHGVKRAGSNAQLAMRTINAHQPDSARLSAAPRTRRARSRTSSTDP